MPSIMPQCLAVVSSPLLSSATCVHTALLCQGYERVLVYFFGNTKGGSRCRALSWAPETVAPSYCSLEPSANDFHDVLRMGSVPLVRY